MTTTPRSNPGAQRRGNGGKIGGGGSYTSDRPVYLPKSLLKAVANDPAPATRYAEEPVSFRSTKLATPKIACTRCSEPRRPDRLTDGVCTNRKACDAILRELYE